MTRTQRYEQAVKRITDAGGTWPTKTAKMTRWPGAGRYERVPCRGCGRRVPPLADGARTAARSCREGS